MNRKEMRKKNIKIKRKPSIYIISIKKNKFIKNQIEQENI